MVSCTKIHNNITGVRAYTGHRFRNYTKSAYNTYIDTFFGAMVEK